MVTDEPGQNRRVPHVLLATCAALPEGERRSELVTAGLAARGVEARWAVWDDPTVDWAAADLVAVRSTWDYHHRLAEFLAWARTVPRLLNGADTFAWNADKSYLVPLGELVPTVPTRLLDGGPVVVKPRVGASGVGLVVLEGGPWVVQPVVESVRTVGESSLYVFGDRTVSQFDKRPGPGEVRVHEQYGGRTDRVPVDAERAELAQAAVAAVERLGLARPAYARVDLMHWEGAWVVSEVELIEPGLYLDVDPVNAEPFAELVADALA